MQHCQENTGEGARSVASVNASSQNLFAQNRNYLREDLEEWSVNPISVVKSVSYTHLTLPTIYSV